ncbi:putative signal transducing protein [Bythopirellula polymerisocia]|uniref:putative signal transducing protein n=1 Tax=Bythopirellula polymerisocia TaxID=2528003 RepID=UPI0011B466B6
MFRGELSNLVSRAKYRGHIPKGSIADSRLCEVYSAATIQEALSIKTVLENAGIDSLILGDHLQNAVGDLPAVAIAPEVWVRTEYSEVARDIIAKFKGELRESKEATALVWECDECGESNESNFDICWNCQAAHDS